MRISHRITLALLSVICIVFAAHAYLSIRWHEELYTTDVQRDQRVMGRGLIPAVTTLWDPAAPEEAIRVVEEADEWEEHTRARWVLPERDPGEPHAPAATGVDLASLADLRDVSFIDRAEPGGRIYLYVPVAIDGELVGAIELSESLTSQRRYVRSRAIRTAAAALVMIAIGGAVSYLVGDRVVGRPVRRLIDKAQRVGGGDFGNPIQLERHGEFSELADEMNAMASRLDAARVHLEEETAARIAAIEQLRHADRLTTVGRLASGIAHEMGTPLNVISERAHMIFSGETETPEETSQSARVVHEQAARLTAIVRQLLDFARRRTPERSRTHLGKLVTSTLDLVRPILDRRGVSVHTYGTEAAIFAEVDPAQIQQVLANLLTNAIDVTETGGTVTVGVAEGEDGSGRGGEPHEARVEVRDQGPGIPGDVIDQVFDPFFTTKPVGEGTGLGLSVADGIARENGGRIEVRTGPLGTSFFLCLRSA